LGELLEAWGDYIFEKLKPPAPTSKEKSAAEKVPNSAEVLKWRARKA
jgi:hypothetical protein